MSTNSRLYLYWKRVLFPIDPDTSKKAVLRQIRPGRSWKVLGHTTFLNDGPSTRSSRSSLSVDGSIHL